MKWRLMARSGQGAALAFAMVSAAKPAGRSMTRNEQRLYVFAACH
jgi:hypothetical protein